MAWIVQSPHWRVIDDLLWQVQNTFAKAYEDSLVLDSRALSIASASRYASFATWVRCESAFGVGQGSTLFTACIAAIAISSLSVLYVIPLASTFFLLFGLASFVMADGRSFGVEIRLHDYFPASRRPEYMDLRSTLGASVSPQEDISGAVKVFERGWKGNRLFLGYLSD